MWRCLAVMWKDLNRKCGASGGRWELLSALAKPIIRFKKGRDPGFLNLMFCLARDWADSAGPCEITVLCLGAQDLSKSGAAMFLMLMFLESDA